jgi:hypothetical protein
MTDQDNGNISLDGAEEYKSFIDCKDKTQKDFLSISNIETTKDLDKIQDSLLGCLKKYNVVKKHLLSLSEEEQEAAQFSASRLLFESNIITSFKKRDTNDLAKSYVFYESIVRKEADLWREVSAPSPSIFSDLSIFSFTIILFVIFGIFSKILRSNTKDEFSKVNSTLRDYNEYLSKKMDKFNKK